MYSLPHHDKRQLHILKLLQTDNLNTHVHCRLHTASLNDFRAEGSFEVICYCRVDPIIMSPNVVDSTTIPITVSFNELYATCALQVKAADVICINQAELDEQAAQAKVMGDLYLKACHVDIWLGEELLTKLAIMLIRLVGNGHNVANLKDPSVRSDLSNILVLKVLIALFGRPSFLRRCVVQEHLLSHR